MALDNLGAHTDGGTITEGQDDKEDTSNDLDNLLDNSQNSFADFVVTAGGTFQLNISGGQANLDIYLGNGLIRLTGSPGGAVTIIVPDGDRRIVFENVCGQNATIDTVTGASSPISIPTGVSNGIQVRGIEMTKASDTATSSGALQADGSVAATGDFDWADNQLKRAYLIDYAEGLFGPASAASVTLDLEVASVFDVTMDQNTTFIFDKPPISGRAGSFTLVMRQDSNGNWVPTWPTEVIWNEQSAPTFSTDPNAIDIISFVTIDAGSTWFGFPGGRDFG